MESIDWPVVGKQAGLGLALGFAVGFAAKKALQIALVVIGVLLVVMVGLEHYGYITIHWTIIESWYNQTFNPPGGLGETLQGWIAALASMIPVAGGFGLGFFWGFRKG